MVGSGHRCGITSTVWTSSPPSTEQALYQPVAYSLDDRGLPEQYGGLRVTPSFFRVAQVSPQLGRTFTEPETEPGNEQKVVVSHAFWQGRLGGRTDVIGQDLRLDGRPFQIVGVMPADFRFVRDDSWFWVPAVFTATERSDERRHANNWFMLGRLTAGSTVQQAQAQIDALNLRDLEQFPESRRLLEATGFHTIVASLHDDLVRDVRRALYLLWAGAVVVLLIGCVNIANLTAIRTTTRLREFGLRQAFGASGWRLARQLIAESVLLVVLGALIGIPVGVAALELLNGLDPSTLPRGTDSRVDGVVVWLTLCSSLVLGFLLGLASFARVSMAAGDSIIRQGSRATEDRRTNFIVNGLVVGQVSTAFVLLVGAFLMSASLNRVLAIAPGFNTERLLTASVSLPAVRYPTAESRRVFAERAVAQLRRVPGVETVGLGSAVPFGFCCPISGVHAAGAPTEEAPVAPYLVMTDPGYFEALGLRFVEGRPFDGRDTASSLPVVILDEDLANALWPGESSLDKRVYFDDEVDDNTQFFTVTGVVARHAMRGLVDSQAERGVHYLPLTQHNIWFMTFVIRTADDPHAMVRAVRTEMTSIDPELPMYDVQTMQERIDAGLTLRNLSTRLSVGFAWTSVFLAAVGIYGMLSYRVTRRTKEIGIRIALGSTTRQVFQLVFSNGAWVLGLGLLLGTGEVFLLQDVLVSQLHDIQAMDMTVMVGGTLLLSLVMVVACAGPAQRAASIDPIATINE